MTESTTQDTTTETPAPTPTQITHDAELSAAAANAEATHAVIPNAHAKFLVWLAGAERRGEVDLHTLARAVERVFGRVTDGG